MKKFLLFSTCLFTFLCFSPVVKADQKITIDGKFDDWNDVPKTDISFSYDTYNIKQMALLADDKDLDLYINMSPYRGNGYSTLQPSGYQLWIGERHYFLDFKSVDGQYFDSNNLAPGSSKEFKVYIYEENGRVNKLSATSKGYVTREKTDLSHNDIAEVKLPLRDFEVDSLVDQKITLKNYNLGDQELVVTGASTSPYLLAALGALFATSFVYYKKRSTKVRWLG